MKHGIDTGESDRSQSDRAGGLDAADFPRRRSQPQSPGPWNNTRRWWPSRPRNISITFKHNAREAGVDCATLCIEHDKPYEAIVDTAKNNGCDLVVMASHGLRGVSAILGSETLKVLTHTSVPILVYR